MSLDTYVPYWMLCQLTPPKNPTEEEKARFEKSRRDFAEKAKKECKKRATYLNSVPFFGQAAYAAAIAACENTNFNPGTGDVFGPINQEENEAIRRELARGAPKAPDPPIIEPTVEQKAAYKTARYRYEQAYSQWKAQDIQLAIPTISSAALQVLSTAEKKSRLEDIAKLTVMAQKICKPGWIKTVLQRHADEALAQMQGKECTHKNGQMTCTSPGIVSFATKIVAAAREHLGYVALGVTVLVAAVAAAISGRRSRPRQTAGQ